MKVDRNFEEIYRSQADPWSIGDASAPRYDIYHQLVLRFARQRNTILDIGSGLGAFLARFHGNYAALTGIEVSETAILNGKTKHPFIQFLHGSATTLNNFPDHRYDTIIYSDVICYLNDREKIESLHWIANHLTEGGIALVACWCPGGKYLTAEEFRRLTSLQFRILHEVVLETQHIGFIVENKWNYIAVTVDYETWQPIPQGRSIDWEKDIFSPTEKLLQIGDAEQIPITLMAEMGEFFWLTKNQPAIAEKMKVQWRNAVERGHDVQLHLHPSWLPELGAAFENGQWQWDFSRSKANDIPGDLTALIAQCKAALLETITPIKPNYTVTCFRAGAYQAQPFKKLHRALAENGIFCDSSVYAGGISISRGYDYSLAYSTHDPYFCNPYDPQLKAPPAEHQIVEIPIFTPEPSQRWFLDNHDGSRIAQRFCQYQALQKGKFLSSECYRLYHKIRSKVANIYSQLQPTFPLINRMLPRSLAHMLTHYSSEQLTADHYFVMIGHTKADLQWDSLRENFKILRQKNDCRFVSLSEMAVRARNDLLSKAPKNSASEALFQVRREFRAVMGEDRNAAQSYYLQEMIPLDRERILDYGCGAGYWSARIADTYSWMEVTGIDYGVAFVQKARAKYGSPRVHFGVADFAQTGFANQSFDCIYADNTLEHAFDVDATLRETYRLLSPGGVLIAAIPSDARNPQRICDNHNWKTAPHEVRMRLENAGYVDIEIREIDTFRKLGMSPYPPARDQMMYIRAWKRTQSSAVQRATQAMDWVYRRLEPQGAASSADPVEVLRQGRALCWGYVLVLGRLLEREGYDYTWLTMVAKNHPKGRGPEGIDTHELLSLKVDGKEVLFDVMANTVHMHPLEDLLANPALAKPMSNPDERYTNRGYHLYTTDEWFKRVYKYARKRDLKAFKKKHWKFNIHFVN